jgi:hypothetical protein
MAKKKQLAGKETKLAKLPLTRALIGQEPEAAGQPGSEDVAAAPLPILPEQLVTEEELSPLAEVYLYLVQELVDLQVCLNSGPNPPHFPKEAPALWQLPDPLLMELALWRARQGLRELQTFLSHS